LSDETPSSGSYPDKEPIYGRKPHNLIGVRFSELSPGMKERKIKQAYGFAIKTREKGLKRAEKQIKNLCFELGLPEKVKEGTIYLYRKVFEKRLLKGRSINTIVVALVYHSCKKIGAPRTMKEAARLYNVSEKDAFRTYKLLSKEIGLKVVPSSPCDYLPGFSTKLGLGNDIERKALRMLEKVKIKRSPKVLAAAALCKVSGLTQKEVSKKLRISEVSLREAIKELRG